MPNDNVAYHYTSVEALLSIVKTERFRLGNVFFMNDYLEIEWLFRLVQELVQEMGDDKSNAFLTQLYRNRGFDHIFCGCFSHLSDDLSQWRGYADDGRGVAVGVDLAEVQEANPKTPLRQSPVEYDVVEQRNKVKAILGKCTAGSVGNFGFQAASKAYFELGLYAQVSKNPAFASEQEMRLVCAPTAWSKSRTKHIYKESHFKSLPYGIDFHVRNEKVVPYAEIDCPRNTIKHIMLGPRFGDEMNKAALQLFLSKSGIHDRIILNMQRSEASYRS